MIVGARKTFSTSEIHGTFLDLEYLWVVFKFLPTMAVYASIVIRASILILEDQLCWFPVWACDGLVVSDVDLTAKVLPIVSVDTISSIMIEVVEWTLYGLVVEDIEICIILEIVDEINCDVTLTVREGTVNTYV